MLTKTNIGSVQNFLRGNNAKNADFWPKTRLAIQCNACELTYTQQSIHLAPNKIPDILLSTYCAFIFSMHYQGNWCSKRWCSKQYGPLCAMKRTFGTHYTTKENLLISRVLHIWTRLSMQLNSNVFAKSSILLCRQ